MNYLWDTNILVHFIRNSSTYQEYNTQHDFFNQENRVFISIVSVGEIYSLAFQRHWKSAKLQMLKEALETLTPLPIARQNIVAAYAEIDAFSQGKLLNKPLPKGMSSRNMGKMIYGYLLQLIK